MTAWGQQDFERTEHYAPGDFRGADHQDADQMTASPLTLQWEYHDGAAAAWQLTERHAEDGHSADQIGQHHAELNGPTADQAERTPAEHAWHRGYDAGADGSVALLRDLEREAGQ